MKICKFPGCGKPFYAKELCEGHRKQERKGWELKPLRKRDKGTWGPYSINKGGYMVRVRRDLDGNRYYQLEHRVVMEDFLGRDLLPEENVHHKNGNRVDNRIDNLELWNVSQPPGQRIEDKVDWARQILIQYDSELEISQIEKWRKING